MKRFIYLVVVYVFTVQLCMAQEPSWTVDEHKFQYTMTLLSFLNIDGIELASENDKVAAFVNGECRGVTNLKKSVNSDKYYAYLTIFSNESNDIVSFKIYDSANDRIIDVAKTITFEINKHYGTTFQPVSLANPALSSEVDIVSFNLKGIASISNIVNTNSVNIEVDNGTDLSSVTIEYALSEGAALYDYRTLLESGVSRFNLYDPLVLMVLSEDRSVAKEWTINVNQDLSSTKFYKKDAVCYSGGAIKVVLHNSTERVTLKQGNQLIATKELENGEVIFLDLEVGTYIVSLGEEAKEIKIELKD